MESTSIDMPSSEKIDMPIPGKLTFLFFGMLPLRGLAWALLLLLASPPRVSSDNGDEGSALRPELLEAPPPPPPPPPPLELELDLDDMVLID
jgi:hypothetical protein